MQAKVNIPLDDFSSEDFEREENANTIQLKKKSLGGRPRQINIDQLLTQRDQLIEILSFAWGEIGWELITARTCENLISAFACLKGRVHSNEYLFRLFWRAPSVQTSASGIRETKRKRAQLVSKTYKLTELREPLADNLRRSLGTLKQKTDNENLEILLDSHFQRMVLLRANTKELDSVEKELKELESTLIGQEAAYAQSELLNFIGSGKYAHNPRNLAQAMAGLPEVSCSYSFQQCEKEPSPLWPTRPDEIPTLSYRTFQLIEESCDRWTKEPDKPLASILLERVRIIPPLNDLRTNLKPDWRYLRRAVEETDLTGSLSGAAPYRIFAAFVRKRGEPRSSEESTLAEIESAEI